MPYIVSLSSVIKVLVTVTFSSIIYLLIEFGASRMELLIQLSSKLHDTRQVYWLEQHVPDQRSHLNLPRNLSRSLFCFTFPWTINFCDVMQNTRVWILSSWSMKDFKIFVGSYVDISTTFILCVSGLHILWLGNSVKGLI